MKAAQISEYGGPEVINVAEVEQPQPGEGQVLVEVHAASLNPFDSMVRAGYVQAMIPSLPITLGGDISGVVTAVGEGVSGLRVGDEVYGSAAAVAGASGALAEYAVTASGQLGKKPQSVDFDQAAASVLVGVSALQAIDEHINLQAGQKLLVLGGAGGIGSIAIQIAKARGAFVATTVKAADVDYATSLGADQVINYESDDLSQLSNDFDAVFDTTKGDALEAALATLKEGGVAVSMLGSVDEAAAAAKKVMVISQGTQVNTERLGKLAALIDEGVVKARIAKSFALEDVQAAFEAREGGAAGKIVLHIK